ncbi:4-hydroxyphenylpyruvate dioxygenase family protein [Fluviispira vulneris]|uniref:4-hydroxyphenylpyruvate dioxygenase family protein n=1 Tax=Fluviispira vulneris TaxID=2763012 RepID=UPI0016443481|nr:VOC family protein [Fluviispira vulneris]
MQKHHKSIGLVGYHSVQFFTRELEKTVNWHKEKFGFIEMAKSSPEWEKKNGMRSIVLNGAGKLGWIFTEPIEKASSAGRYLSMHPDGAAFLNFRVKNLKHTAEFLVDKKAPFLYDIESHKSNNDGYWNETAIATAIDDVGFRFIEEKNYDQFAPGFVWTNKEAKDQPNSLGLDLGIDHVTCNARSMHSLTEFYRHCLGFEQYWGIEFHTAHHTTEHSTGSGLESIVMWDKESGIKFATNQPLAPYFHNSQIEIYIEDNRGSGIQHLALGTKNIIHSVSQIKERNAVFLDASDKYYQQLPERMQKMKLKKINEPMEIVQKNNILLDGAEGKYLLQIFMKEQSIQFNNKEYGPFFYEIIQRQGDESFGEGNFKALFDSIEKQQVADHRQEMRDRIDSLS